MKRNTPLKANPEKIRAWRSRSQPLQSRSTLKSGSTLKTHSSLKAKKPMNKVGKVGRANLAANKKIAEIAKKEELTRCEICPLQLPELQGVECTESFTLANVHRHKRAYYKGDADALSDRRQWVKGCVGSHDAIEHNKELTEKVFEILRGPE